MIALALVPALDPGVLAWLAAVLAAAGGVALHVLAPPTDPDVAEALLLAAVHP